jgi:hypothetical protein
LTVIQASPDEPSLDFYLNGKQVNQNPLNYLAGIDYFSAFAGQRTANFYNHANMSQILSAPVTLNQNMAYSLFLANTAASPEVVLLSDTLNKPPAGSASIRFVNLSPDAPAVDLAVQGGSVLAANKPFKGYSSFVPLAAKNYTFEIRKAGSNTVLATLADVVLVNGSVYTVYFHGLVTPANSTDVLSATFITNAIF